ncbi:MAG: DUF2130 domain-containing protein [Gammaproteobacteria bacterium]
MISNVVICQNCGEQVSITEALSAEMESFYKTKLEKEMKTQVAQLEADSQKKLAREKDKMLNAIKEEKSIELEDLKNQLVEQRMSSDMSKKRELDLMKRARDLETAMKNTDLEIQRKVDEATEKVRMESVQKANEESRIKLLEKDKQIDDFKKQVDEWRRKAEQGSQKTQGEVLEMDVERMLKDAFPVDIIEPVKSGVRGADIVQIIMTKSGNAAGKILWEVKNSKNFSEGWIDKLKEDQRECNADLAVIVTQSMPKGHVSLVYMDGVWVADFYTYVGLASALKVGLLQAFHARIASANKDEKKDAMYEYLVGIQFRQRVEALIESNSHMRNELEREKRATYRNWATREQQINRMISSTAGMYGDICGIVGTALPRIALLELDTEEIANMVGE